MVATLTDLGISGGQIQEVRQIRTRKSVTRALFDVPSMLAVERGRVS
jgi:Lhr-like helicase